MVPEIEGGRMKNFYIVATWLACFCQLSASLTITLPEPVLEGTNLTITCTTSGVGAGAVSLLVNGQLSGISGDIQSDTTMRVFVYGTVDRSNNGTMFQCLNTFDNSMSDVAILDVQWPPSFALSVPSGSVQQFIEGSSQEVMVQGLDLGRPTAVGVEWSVNGVGLTSGGGVTVSDSGISFSDLRRSQSGVYSARLSNVHANVTANFTVNVIYPPTFGDRPPTEVQLELNDMFVFNCTPVPGNPDEVITFRKDGSPVTPSPSITVDGPLLIIPSVQRNDSGNYSCTASNTAGMATVYYALAVVVPPGRPENLAFPSIGPFNVTVTWSPPSDNGGTPDPLNYTVALTTTSNGQSVSTTQTTQMQSSFTSLSHSVNYTVSVVAINSLGQQGQSAVGTFRTRDIPPVIGSVAAIALSLSEVQVTVTLSDTGGQPVEEYTVTINGTVMVFSGSADMQFLGNVTNLTLITGLTYSFSVVTRNSVGSSEAFMGTVFVPPPPNITMQPVAVTPNETTTQCCAGIQVFLEKLSDPTLVFTAQVSTDGTPFTDHSVTREGDVVYVEGLQAGTPYNIILTAWNQFGSVTRNVSTTPLIGSPSDPSLPVVSVVGSSVSIQLSTRYPGTNTRGQFKFSLIFSSVSTAKRQSLQPTEVQVDPTGLNTGVTTTHTLTNVGAGSYSVSVMAVNENGASQAIMSETFVVQAPLDNTPLIIGVVVAVVIVFLLAIVVGFIIVLVCMKRKDTKGKYKMEKKEPVNGDEDLKMMGAQSEDPLAPQYEDPDTLSRKPPPAVTYKKAEEAVDAQPNPSGVVYADLDFSRQQMGKRKTVEKKPEPEVTIYSEVRPMTPQERQQMRDREDGDGERPHSPTTIM